LLSSAASTAAKSRSTARGPERSVASFHSAESAPATSPAPHALNSSSTALASNSVSSMVLPSLPLRARTGLNAEKSIVRVALEPRRVYLRSVVD